MALRVTRLADLDSQVSVIDLSGEPASAERSLSAPELWDFYWQLRSLQRGGAAGSPTAAREGASRGEST